MEDEGQCGKCDEVFPFVNILRCRQFPRITQDDLPLCSKCHQRLHPTCRMGQSVLRPPHFVCSLCQLHRGTVICAMCTLDDEPTDEILEGVLMCTACSDSIHSLKQYHSDHFYPVAGQQLIPVMGAVRWENPSYHLSNMTRQEGGPASHKCSQPTLASHHHTASARHVHTRKIEVERRREEFPCHKKLLMNNRHCHKDFDTQTADKHDDKISNEQWAKYYNP